MNHKRGAYGFGLYIGDGKNQSWVEIKWNYSILTLIFFLFYSLKTTIFFNFKRYLKLATLK